MELPKDTFGASDITESEVVQEEETEELKQQADISDQLLKQAMEQIKDLEAEQTLAVEQAIANARPEPVSTNEQEVQTEVDYPIPTVNEVEVIKEVKVEVIKEVIKEVTVVKEVLIKEDSDKIDDTDITIESNGHYKIFEQLENPEDPESSEDSLSVEFLQRTKVSQIKILLAEIKKHRNSTDEAFIKIEYIKKLYGDQLKKLSGVQRTLREKEIQLEIRETEIAIQDEQIKTQDYGNVQNLSSFKEQEAKQARTIVNL